MTDPADLASLSPPQLALRLYAERGDATYAAYVVAAGRIPEAIGELRDELDSFHPAITVVRTDPRAGEALSADQPGAAGAVQALYSRATGTVGGSVGPRVRV